MERQCELEQRGKKEQQVPNSFQRQKRNSLANKEYNISSKRRKSLKSQRKNMSAQYHKSIARQRRQQKITVARETIHISNIHTQMNNFQQKLNTRYKRQKFIKRILQKITDNPNEKWKQAIDQLLWGIKCLYINKQLERIITNGVIDKLCLSFDSSFIKQNLWPKTAYLLQKIAFLEPTSIKHILNLKLQENQGDVVLMLYSLTSQQTSSLGQISNCIQLITTMMSTNCKTVTSIIGLDNALMHAINWLQRTLSLSKSIENTLSKIYRYLVYLVRQISLSWETLHRQFRFIIKNLMETLNQTVQLHQHHQSYQKLLIIISTLTQYSVITKSEENPLPQSHRLNVNLPVCMIVASMHNLLHKIIQFTPNQLKQTAKIVIKMLQISTEAQQENIQLCEILKRHLKGQKRKIQNSKQNQTYDNKRNTTRTIPIINNFISYLLVIYQHNLSAKNIIFKIQSFFKDKIQQISHSKPQEQSEKPNLNDTQSNLQNSQINNRDVQI